MALLLNPSTITFTVAKARVARAAGVVGDTDWEAIAGDCIVEALHTWEIKRDWSWLWTTSAAIPLVSQTSTYTLPAAFRKPFSARVNDTYLHWMPQRYYDRANPGGTGSGSGSFYTMFNSATTGMIELLPPVGVLVAPLPNLYVRFWRKITKPVAGADLLDIPSEYEDGIIALAKQLLLMDKGGDDTRMITWAKRAKDILDLAIINEERQGDYTAQFVSESMQPTTGWNPNSLDTLLYG